MDLFKIVFWIATLFGSLQAYPVCKKRALKIKEMKTVTCGSDSTFYTPQNVEDKCITAALDCVRKELHVAQNECEDPYEYIDQSIKMLERMINERLDKDNALESNECSCEKWHETNFTTFLESFNSLCESSSSSS